MIRGNKMSVKVKKILIIINVTIILSIVWFYICRLVHFYRLENPNIPEDIALGNYLTLDKNIAVSGSGLYKLDDKYVFIGRDVNNYLLYSGILFRIVSVDDDSIKLITDEVQTSIFWGNDLNYNVSSARKWLNKIDNVNFSGIFYNILNNPDLYLQKSDFCADKVANASYSCLNKQNDYIGLLTVNEYEQAKGSESYLNIGSYFWTINTSEQGIWYVMDTGEINDNAFTEQNYYSYGIRPVINLKKNVKMIAGDGTKNNPYRIENNFSNLLNSKNVGEYINYSNHRFRIINKDNGNVTLALDGFIQIENSDFEAIFSEVNPNFNLNEGLGYYLNTDFYNSLENKELLVKSKWYNGIYVNDYASVYNTYVESYIGLMKVGDFYINDYDNYYLINRNNDYDMTIYKVLDNKLYADLIQSKAFMRPTLSLNGDVTITSGTGSRDNPYIIG